MQSQIKGGYADFLDKLCLYSLLSSEELVFNFQNCKLPKTIEQFLYNPRIFFFLFAFVIYSEFQVMHSQHFAGFLKITTNKVKKSLFTQ